MTAQAIIPVSDRVLGPAQAVTLAPPAEAAGRLTVKIWTAERVRGSERAAA